MVSSVQYKHTSLKLSLESCKWEVADHSELSDFSRVRGQKLQCNTLENDKEAYRLSKESFLSMTEDKKKKLGYSSWERQCIGKSFLFVWTLGNLVDALSVLTEKTSL